MMIYTEYIFIGSWIDQRTSHRANVTLKSYKDGLIF